MEKCKDFILLRLTYLRPVNIALFTYDYDQTWTAFFLDADLRIYCRYGCRDASSADSHNSPEGLLHTMDQVLAIHKEESGKALPPPKLPKPVVPTDLPELTDLRYNGSCVRCHMVHETQYHRQRKAGTFTPRSLWLYPLPDNVGIKLDAKLGNIVREIKPDSFAAKAGMQAGDRIRSANGSRVVTVADLQFVLNGLEAKSQLTLQAERDGKPVTAMLELDGDWRRTDPTWRKSVRLMTWRQAPFTRFLTALPNAEKTKLGIPAENFAFRLARDSAEAQKVGLRKDDVVVAFNGKRKVSYRNPAMYFYLEHQSGEKMEVTYLRDGKEQKMSLVVP